MIFIKLCLIKKYKYVVILSIFILQHNVNSLYLHMYNRNKFSILFRIKSAVF